MGNSNGPMRGEAVYYDGWEQPNGYIVHVRWVDDEREICCKSWENGELSYFDERDFDRTWMDRRSGGIWFLSDPPTPEQVLKLVGLLPKKIPLKYRLVKKIKPTNTT